MYFRLAKIGIVEEIPEEKRGCSLFRLWILLIVLNCYKISLFVSFAYLMAAANKFSEIWLTISMNELLQIGIIHLKSCPRQWI